MIPLPKAIADYLNRLAAEQRAPAYLLVDEAGQLIEGGGHLGAYGLADLHAGEPVGARAFFLEGLFPLAGTELLLPCVQTSSDRVADLHLFTRDEGDYVLLLDATAQERQQRLMQQKGNELSLSYQRLLKEIQKKEILLHCIVHDLAGPLMGIRGGFELLAKENLSPQGRKFLELGLRQTLKQDTLIREILQAFAAEVESSATFQVDPSRAPDALHSAREVCEALASAFALQQVKLQLDPQLDTNKDWRVRGEKGRLERVFSNLIENALRHSPANATVTIGCHEAADNQVLVTIDDEGPGIPLEVAVTLFQKFAQGKQGRGKIGLGLYFCRITIEHWGGQIGFAQRAAGGTRFWFQLPRPQNSQPAKEHEAA
jgi:signal transduction histidine kinase